MIPIFKLISQYLIHSYLYYGCSVSLMPDHEYDQLCRDLLRRWDEVEACEHDHARLLELDALKAGSGYHIHPHRYPRIVVGAATELAKEAGKVQYDKKKKLWYQK